MSCQRKIYFKGPLPIVGFSILSLHTSAVINKIRRMGLVQTSSIVLYSEYIVSELEIDVEHACPVDSRTRFSQHVACLAGISADLGTITVYLPATSRVVYKV